MSYPFVKSGKKPEGDIVEICFSTKIHHAKESSKFTALSVAATETYMVSKVHHTDKALVERANKAKADNAKAIGSKLAIKAVKAKFNPQIAKAAEEFKVAVDNAAAATPITSLLRATVKGNKFVINVTEIKNNLKAKTFRKKVRKALIAEGVFADADDAKAFVADQKDNLQKALDQIIDAEFGELNNAVESAERELKHLKASKAARIEDVTGKAAERSAMRQVRRAKNLVQRLVGNTPARALLLKKGKRYTENLSRNAKIAIASVIGAFSESARECIKRKFYRSNAVVSAVQNLATITAKFKNFTSAIDRIAIARHFAENSGFVSYLRVNG
jgi:hypothetical protein